MPKYIKFVGRELQAIQRANRHEAVSQHAARVSSDADICTESPDGNNGLGPLVHARQNHQGETILNPQAQIAARTAFRAVHLSHWHGARLSPALLSVAP